MLKQVRGLMRAHAARPDAAGPQREGPSVEETRAAAARRGPVDDVADAGPVDDVADAELERLEAEAHYHRERLALYRAKAYGPRPTSLTRLGELERMSARAQDRLEHAHARRPHKGRSAGGG